MDYNQGALAAAQTPNLKTDSSSGPVIPKVLESLEASIMEAIQLANQLESRLSPVLRLEPPSTAGTQGISERSPKLSDILSMDAQALRHLNATLGSILRRLEV